MESGNEAQEIEEVEEEEEEEEEEKEGEEAGGQIEDIKILHLMIASVSDDSVGLSFLVSTHQISRARDHDTFHKIMNTLSSLLSLFFSFSSLSFLLPSSSFS